jgi:hypothetical protein
LNEGSWECHATVKAHYEWLLGLGNIFVRFTGWLVMAGNVHALNGLLR